MFNAARQITPWTQTTGIGPASLDYAQRGAEDNNTITGLDYAQRGAAATHCSGQ